MEEDNEEKKEDNKSDENKDENQEEVKNFESPLPESSPKKPQSDSSDYPELNKLNNDP